MDKLVFILHRKPHLLRNPSHTDVLRQHIRRNAADIPLLAPNLHQPPQATMRTDRTRQFWQQSEHPVEIWTAESWQTKVQYIHDNPVRKGLVWEATAWRFSSAGYWLLDPPGETEVVLTAAEW